MSQSTSMHSGDPASFAPPRRSGRRYLGFSLLAAAGALLILPFLAWQWMNVNPRFTRPAVILPSPNAYDLFREAAALFPPTESDRLTALMADEPRDGPGGAKAPRHTDAERAAFVRRNSGVLRRFRRGLGHAYREPVQPSGTPFFQHYTEFRSLARLLRLEGQVRSKQGNWTGSLESDLDALHLGVDMPHGSPVIGLLVGSAIQAIGRRDTWESVAHLPPGIARTTARRLEGICARQAPFAETVEMEKLYSQGALVEAMRKPDWRRQMLSDMTSLGGPVQPWPKTSEEWALFAQLHTTSKTTAFNNMTGYFDAVLAVVRQPNGLTAPLPAPPTDPVNQIMAPVLEQARFNCARDRSLNELLLLTLALRAYHDERRRYPAALAALVPGFLKALPTDPFAGTASYRYHRTATGYLLYSVGPDGKDDGGQPLVSPTFAASRNSTQRHKIEIGATGDVVAGTNIQ